MVISLRRVLRGLLFAALFLLLTLAIAEALRLTADWLRLPDARAVPRGRAVEAIVNGPDGRDGSAVLDRLRMFYLAGD
jgi:hypothetical protein